MEGEYDLSKLIRDVDYRKPTECSKCGKSLKYMGIGEYQCEYCGHIEYDDYGIVRGYVEKNPGANVMQVERATGVPKQVINSLVRKGKLDVKKGGSLMED